MAWRYVSCQEGGLKFQSDRVCVWFGMAVCWIVGIALKNALLVFVVAVGRPAMMAQ